HVQGQNLTRPSVYREIRLILRQPPSAYHEATPSAAKLKTRSYLERSVEPLITLVPYGNRVEAELDVHTAHLPHLRLADPAPAQLVALPFQRHGTVPGRLRVITENSFQSDKSAATAVQEAKPGFFRARVALGAAELLDVPKDFRLIPGMTLAAEIKIGRR